MQVLLVDDDPDVATMVERRLVFHGHEVERMSSSFGLVNRVAGIGQRPPDIVILDHFLPGLSGLSVLAILGKDVRTQSIPVILYSAAPAAMLATSEALHPKLRVVQKGGSLKDLIQAVDDATGASRSKLG